MLQKNKNDPDKIRCNVRVCYFSTINHIIIRFCVKHQQRLFKYMLVRTHTHTRIRRHICTWAKESECERNRTNEEVTLKMSQNYERRTKKKMKNKTIVT